MSTINTIDDVIHELDQIIQECQDNHVPLGYFAALYRKVTIEVKKGIIKGSFDDGPRMETLDVIFAKRYIDAYRNHEKNQVVTASWLRAFELAPQYWPIVLQRLLIGMNAHINLDLGIAAAEVMKGKDIQHLKNDFNKINDILSKLVVQVEEDLSQIWPFLKKLLKLAGKVDDFLINFSMKIARDGAWSFAEELSKTSEADVDAAIDSRDKSVAKIADLITNPGWIASLLFKIIRITEKGTVAEKIQKLID
jgi:hypothetical protein